MRYINILFTYSLAYILINLVWPLCCLTVFTVGCNCVFWKENMILMNCTWMLLPVGPISKLTDWCQKLWGQSDRQKRTMVGQVVEKIFRLGEFWTQSKTYS